jgi:hypothetical protein
VRTHDAAVRDQGGYPISEGDTFTVGDCGDDGFSLRRIRAGDTNPDGMPTPGDNVFGQESPPGSANTDAALRRAIAPRSVADRQPDGGMGQHRDATTARLRAAETVAQHVDTAAAEGLIAALTANATPAVEVEDGENTRMARLGRETEIAGSAVARLGAELGDAEERLRVPGASARWRLPCWRCTLFRSLKGCWQNSERCGLSALTLPLCKRCS